jgi:N12 class adenine-specific DNA methylase
LVFPGKADKFEPHPYQRDAVARIIAEPTVLLDHVVGAGKTGTMFMGPWNCGAWVSLANPG